MDAHRARRDGVATIAGDMSAEARDGAVFDLATQFIAEMWSQHGSASEMHIGDLAWGTFNCWPSGLGALRLWPDDAGRTQALTMFDGEGVCDLVVRPGGAGLDAAATALTWAETARRSALGSQSGEFRVGRRVQSTQLVELLLDSGFERRSVGVPAMSRTITIAGLAPPVVPSGYEVRELQASDLVSRVGAFNAAFPRDGLSVDAYRALQSCGPYVPRLDVVAKSPTAAVAAFATLWLDPKNAVVQIEPAGCHPEHRRLGLSRAVILQALRWSVDLGATTALVRHVDTNDAARALYESCGFSTACRETGFMKPIPETA